MKRDYVVVQADGFVSSNENGEAESFESFAKAERRAKSLAQIEPGAAIGIYERVAEVSCAVGPAVTERTKR